MVSRRCRRYTRTRYAGTAVPGQGSVGGARPKSRCTRPIGSDRPRRVVDALTLHAVGWPMRYAHGTCA
ncbi:hypothetical protein YT1_1651 [Rhodococcus ruber]|nr:hypothetical protein YT1_1651 [Rhodococcus ruber]